MTDPNDPWSSLADELGVDGSSKPAEEKASPAARGRRRKSGGEGEEPAGGRGRRRSARPAPPEDTEAPPPGVLLDEPESADGEQVEVGDAPERDDGTKKKRRRRSRRKKDGAHGEPGAEVRADTEGDSAADEEADLTPIEDYATWKLPSWQELIDGLHKP